MRDLFFWLMIISALGILPFSVMFFVQLGRKRRKEAMGFSALGCIIGTIVFMCIGVALTPVCDHEFKEKEIVAATCTDKGYTVYRV